MTYYRVPSLINGLATNKLASDPAAEEWPETGYVNVFMKTDNQLYKQEPDGTVSALTGGGTSGIEGIDIRNEGVQIVALGTILDFVGNGVTASYASGPGVTTVTCTDTVGVTLQSNGSGVATNATTLNFSNKFTVSSLGAIGLTETYLQTLGGTMTGYIVLHADPSADMHPVTRQYLEAALEDVGEGDVQGPASATDNAITRFDGTTGKLVQNSNATIDDSGNLAAGGTIAAVGTVTGSNLSGVNTGDQFTFGTISVAGQSNVVAEATSDTLTLVAGANIAITTDAGTDTITIALTGISAGDVVGPASATDNALARFDGTTGKLIQNGSATLDDSGHFATNGNITATGTVGGSNLSGTNTGDQNTFGTISVSGQSNVVADTASDTLTLVAGANIAITTDAGGDSVTFAVTGMPTGTNTGDQNLFSTIAVSGQTNVVADSTSDTLTLVAGTNVTITTDPSTDSITISASGGGGGGSGDVVGPASATDNAITRFDSTTGKLIQNSSATLDDSGNLVTNGNVTATGTVGGSNLSGSNTGDQNVFGTISVSGQSNVVADTTSDTLTLAAGANIAITTDAGTDTVTIAVTGMATGDVVGPGSATDNAIARFDSTTGKLIQNSAATVNDSGNIATSGTITGSNLSGTNTGDQNLFSTIAVSGQSNVVADATSDTLTFAAGANMTITTDAATDTVTFAASSSPKQIFLRPTDFLLSAGTTAASLLNLPTPSANLPVISYSDSSDTNFWTNFVCPSNWTGSNFTIRIIWEPTATSTSTVEFEVRARSYVQPDKSDQAWSTAVVVTDNISSTSLDDTVNVTNDFTITPTGTVQAGALVGLNIKRESSDASTSGGFIHAVIITYT